MSKAAKLLHLLAHRDYRRGLQHGVAGAIEHEDVLRSLEIGSVLDLGANKGQFSLVARRFNPHAVIHAFEPLSEPADVYEKLFAADALTTLHRVATGSEAGQAIIHVSQRMDSSSLLPISARQEEIFPGTREASRRSISVMRADDVLAEAFLPGPLLVKLDVQGFELAALKGMPNLLKQAAYVYTEVSFLPLYDSQPLAHDLVSFLGEVGFVFAGVHNVVCRDDGAAVQADLLFAGGRNN